MQNLEKLKEGRGSNNNQEYLEMKWENLEDETWDKMNEEEDNVLFPCFFERKNVYFFSEWQLSMSIYSFIIWICWIFKKAIFSSFFCFPVSIVRAALNLDVTKVQNPNPNSSFVLLRVQVQKGLFKIREVIASDRPKSNSDSVNFHFSKSMLGWSDEITFSFCGPSWLHRFTEIHLCVDIICK